MTVWPPEAFVGDHVVLDFLNTTGGATKARDVERLPTYGDAVAWARAAGLLDAGEAARLATSAATGDAARALGELRAQREALHAFLLAGIEGADPQPAAHAHVQSDLRAGYAAAELSARPDAASAWSVPPDAAGLDVIARRIALATGALLTGGERASIRVCHACSWMYLDRSPTKRRRWCSMATCGNRAKARRHHRRSTATGRQAAGGR